MRNLAPPSIALRSRHRRHARLHRAARAGAVAPLQRGSFCHAGEQWMFEEKGGKSREIPVRHDLEQIFEYLDAAEIRNAPGETPLFRTAFRKTGRLTGRGLYVVDVCRMVKRRLRAARLSGVLSPPSFRLTTIADLLEQGVPLEDVQRLAGHADPRTTRLSDRRQKNSPATSSSGFRFEVHA
jgi:integrase/recombinase XerD